MTNMLANIQLECHELSATLTPGLDRLKEEALQGYDLNERSAAFLPTYCASIGGPTWLVYAISSLSLLNAAVVSIYTFHPYRSVTVWFPNFDAE